MKRTKNLLMLVIILAASPLYSATENFRAVYQGIFKINGVPFSGTKGFVFRIRNGSGGTIQWESQCNDITMSSGIFRVTLGANDGVGNWNTIDWNAIDAYLEVVIGDPFTCNNAVSAGPQERFFAGTYSLLASKTSSVPFAIDSSRFAVDKDSVYKVTGGSVSVDSQGAIFIASTTDVSNGNLNVSNGKIQENGFDLLPSSTVMFYDGASCPSGWSEYTASRGRFLAGVPSGGSIGGTTGSALTNLANAHSHTHDVNIGATTAGGGEPSSGAAGACCCGPDASRMGGSHSVDPANTTTGAAQTGVPYVQVLLCKKN